ncbi:CLUMA_CG007965, isoform A [Clunio marinus]|uniref:CLUMA_CG007965, isoform A n=1 Tax=Clunio marinus TaxID=568069 RepID=A0A1J1I3Y4_9DIPT|nr:CLUMA_CG007965, isoform A [Clunio marinus]
MADNNENPKLEWMYKTGQDLLNREEYLTGRKVDKQFEELTTSENCVEHEVLPASISRRTNLFEKHDQVDIVRKQMEDPLMAIKQKEMEARRKILENPVKLKELHRLLKKEKDEHGLDKSPKHPSKKSKKKRKSSSSDSSSDSEDLDKLLIEKYKNIKDNSRNDSDDDSNFIEKKFKTLKNELDRIVKNKKKKRSLSRDSGRRNSRERRRESPERRRRRRDSPERKQKRDSPVRRRRESPVRRRRESPQSGRRRDSPERRRRNKSTERCRDSLKKSDKKMSNDRNRDERKRKSSASPKRYRRDSPSPREKNKDTKYRNPSPPRRKSSSPERKASSSERESSPVRKQTNYDDSDDEQRQRKPKAFGLVTASGEKIALMNKGEIKRYTKEELKPIREAPKKQEVKRRKSLTEEEMDKIRLEMMENAEWREKDREKTVKKYRESEEREKLNHEKEFDKTFLNRAMKKAQDQVSSVESRIKSKLNNIQRSSRTMDSNFAKR